MATALVMYLGVMLVSIYIVSLIEKAPAVIDSPMPSTIDKRNLHHHGHRAADPLGSIRTVSSATP
jgi:hypothetical protein